MTRPALRRAAWTALAVLAAAAGGFALFDAFVDPEVPVAAASRRDLVQSVVASGRVAAPNRIDVGTQVVGTVERVPVAEGQVVKAGDLLFVLEASEARALARQAEVAVAQAEARLRQVRDLQLPVAEQALRQAVVNRDNARTQYERSRALYEKGFYGRSQLDDAKRNLDVAEAQAVSAAKQHETARPGGSDAEVAATALAQARAAADAARARLGYAEVRAPVDGTLIARSVERGDVVQPGRTLLVLSPAGATQLVLQIDERNLARIATGQPARASADAYPKERFEAVLSYINPGVDAQRGTVEVKLDVPRPPAYLRQDMTVSVDIEVGRRTGALVVPAGAVHEAGGAAWVYRVNGHRVHRTSVRAGLRAEGVVEVLEGLKPDDVVVAEPAPRLRDGQPVRPRPRA